MKDSINMKSSKLKARLLVPKCLAALIIIASAFFRADIATAAAPPKMNVVLILADDFGWADLACYGSEYYESPNIDRLARDGMKFTQAYSACTVCSPTRAALLTGKYPARLHITDWIPGLPPENPKLLVPDWTKYLPLEEVTIARALKSANYATASIGKWHLGGEAYYPDKQGFDINIAGTEAPSPKTYFAPYNIATLPEGPKGEYLTDRLGDEALHYIDQHKDKPFFLYFPHFAVHLPVQGKEDLVEKYRAKRHPGQSQSNAVYAAMIESMDQTVGRIRGKLDELKLADHTIVIFASDNGGRVPTTSNKPLRVGKGSCYEGGTRVPFIVYWPGVTKPGSVSDTPVISMDMYPTILEMIGLKDPDHHGKDGVSLVPILKQTGKLKRDALFWHYPHYQHYQLGGTTPYGAIHAGDFKLIEFYDDMRVELYNLKDDISEQKNLADDIPAKVADLRTKLHAWRKEVGAQMPTRNPAYDPAKPEHDPDAKKKKKAE
jgi:arylsulfatase A